MKSTQKWSKMLLAGMAAMVLSFGLVVVGCDDGNDNGDGSGNNNGKHDSEGVYIGIISFAGDVTDLTNGIPVLLNAAGKTALTEKLNSSYVISIQSGTSLFYGVHKALANLKSREAQAPVNLDSVNIITFTDGLDNASSGRSAFNPLEEQSFDSAAEYSTYVNSQITNRRIAGKPITAYSIGVRGGDVTDIPAFQNTLSNIASTGNSRELTNFSDVQSTFNSIADGLNITHSSTSFTLVTTLLDTNTKVRMTFDVTGTDSASAAASTRYIEGTVTRSGTSFSFDSITYSAGISSTNGAGPISGTVNGSEVSFIFNGIAGYNQTTDQATTKQWLQAPGSSTWQINSEYSTTGNTTTNVEHRSTIIYLVLDSSTSLNTTQIGQIRQAAITFINNLYTQTGGGGTGGSAISLSSDSWYDNSFSSFVEHTYQFYAAAGTTYYISWNDSYEGSGGKTCDIKVSATRPDGSTLFSGVDSGYTLPRSVYVTTSGYITIKVQPYSSSDTGIYAIRYY